MPTTAIVATQILDSGSVGRDVLASETEAEAQAAIGVTGVDTSADYIWTGNHTFEETVVLEAAEWNNTSGVINQPSIAGFTYLAFNGTNVFRASALDFIPMNNGTKAFGRSDLRFSDVFSVNGSFTNNLNVETGGSYKLYNLGTENDADTEYLEIFFDANTATIASKVTGAGAEGGITLEAYSNNRLRLTSTGFSFTIGGSTKLSSTANDLKVYTTRVTPFNNDTTSLGTTTNRWSNVASVNGDFSDTVTANAFVGDGSGLTGLPSGNPFDQDLNTTDSPSFIGGSFTGSLVSETGGSLKIYDLGTEGDTDTEFGELAWDSNRLILGTQTTGAGVGRELRLTAGLSRVDIRNNGNIQIVQNNATKAIFGNANITIYKYLQPNSDLGVNFGSASRRWNIGHFGDVQASTMTLSSLPTSDPAVEGQLWNDSGAVKISAG